MDRTKTLLGGGLSLVIAIAAAKLLLHLATASRYGYFGDELYFLACGEHLDWGYVDQPPLVAVVAWLVRHTLGTSLFAIRLPSALAGVALVVLTGLLAREMGGGRFAMGLAAVGSSLGFVYVVIHYLFTMNAFEPLFWTGCAYVLVRIVRTGDQRLWLAFGVLAGVGLQNKYSMAVNASGLVVGVVLSPERRGLARPWIWLGGALAFLIFLPNLIWNVQHGWPFFELMRNIRASGRDVALGPFEYVARQAFNMNPANLPLTLTGIGWLLLSARGRAFRPLGWAFLVTLATFIVTKGKDYYLAPAFATLFAAGAVGLEGATAMGRRRLLRVARGRLLLAERIGVLGVRALRVRILTRRVLSVRVLSVRALSVGALGVRVLTRPGLLGRILVVPAVTFGHQSPHSLECADQRTRHHGDTACGGRPNLLCGKIRP